MLITPTFPENVNLGSSLMSFSVRSKFVRFAKLLSKRPASLRDLKRDKNVTNKHTTHYGSKYLANTRDIEAPRNHVGAGTWARLGLWVEADHVIMSMNFINVDTPICYCVLGVCNLCVCKALGSALCSSINCCFVHHVASKG